MKTIAAPMDPAALPARNDSGYPEPFRSRVLPREKRALGDAAGLTKIGVNLTTLGPGAAFPAGRADGHQFMNRSSEPAVYLEISNRDEGDAVEYPDVDLRWNAPGARGRYTHKDGTPY